MKPEISPPEITITPGHRLAVPQPGTNVRDMRLDPRDVQTSQSQETAHIQVVKSSMETQTNDWNPTNEDTNFISMVNPIYGNVPTSRTLTPEGDFAEFERMMMCSSYPADLAVPLPIHSA